MLAETVTAINQKINTLSFNTLWPGFSKKAFALYDEKFVYANERIEGLAVIANNNQNGVFIAKRNEQFNGNTAIKIKKQYVAIWDASTIEDTPINKLSAMIVHEMFHAHQYENKEQRFPDELVGINYPVGPDNFFLRYIERDLLLKAAEAPSRQPMIEYLARFFSVRLRRKEMISESLQYEKAIETVEGSAVYVEFQAYKALGNNNLTPVQYMNKYKKIDLEYLSIRKSTYDQGLLLGLIADTLIPEWKDKFLTDDIYLSDYIEVHVNDLQSIKNTNETSQFNGYQSVKTEINDCINKWIDQRNSIFRNFEENKKGIKMNESFKVTGFDPLNTVKFGDNVIHQNFLRINRGQGDEILKGPVKTKIGESVFDILEMEI